MASPVRWAALLGFTAGLHAAGLGLGVFGGGAPPGPRVIELSLTVAEQDREELALPESVELRVCEPVDGRREPYVPPRAAAMPEVPPPQAPEPHVPSRVAEAERLAWREAGKPAPALTAEPPAMRPSRETGPALPDAPLTASLPAGGPVANAQSPSGAPGGAARKGAAFEAAFELALQRNMPGEGIALPGKPVYPTACRRGTCRAGVPCEGLSRWRVTAAAADALSARVELTKSAGCALLDASVKKFLSESRIPKAGTFVFAYRFVIEE